MNFGFPLRFPVKIPLSRFLTLFSTLALSITWTVALNASGEQIEPRSLTGKGLATISTPHGVVLFAEIADTPAKRAQGLMFRTHMAPDHGMLFTFPELGHWTFWMKNTKMPLDIIWLDGNGKVVHIEPKVPICTRTDEGCPRYHSQKKAIYVLELKAEMAERFKIYPGTPLSIVLP